MAKDNITAEAVETKTVIQKLMVQPARLESADVSTYKAAVNQAKWGYYSKWFDLVENLMSDGFLGDQIDKLISTVTNSELQFQIDGKSVDVINDLIDTPEFEELISEIALSKVFGKSVVATSFVPEFEVFSFPRKHLYVKNIGRALADREKVITTMPGGTTGYDYTADDFVLEFGKDGDLGLMYKVAQYVIYKRGNFGDWAQYAEIFGMPFVLGKYNSTDVSARDQLFSALSEIGGKPVAAVPKETDVEIVWNSGSGSSDLYKALKDACNEEIMITILGETMTTLSGSSRSQSETHADTLDDKAKTMCRFVERMLNKKFLPLLVKRGYPVAGGKFVFPEATENLSVENISNLAKLIKIPVKWIHEKYAIPMPEGDEEVAGSVETSHAASPAIEPATDEPKPTDPKKPPVETSPAASKKDKAIKLSDTDRNLMERFFDFFAVARTMGSRAIQQVTERSRGLNLADKSTSFTAGINIDKLFEDALRDIYLDFGVGSEVIVPEQLFSITNTSLQKGITKGFSVEFGKSDPEFINQFRTNTSVFAAFKAHAQMNDIAAQITDEDGNLRSFHDFKKAVLGTSIKADYNKNWLKTEYNMAVRSARMAEKWKQFESVKHLYPNLEFIESTAANKRPEHLQWVGTILPIEHPWWNTHTPPVGWGCECDIRNTDKEVTTAPGYEEEVNPVFANNPGKTAEFLNMDEHPYKKRCDERVHQEIITIAIKWVNGEMKMVNNKLIRQKEWGIKNIAGKYINHTDFESQIKFTTTGVKEFLNQPHKHYEDKNKLIKKIDKVLEKSTYMGWTDYKLKKGILKNHIFEITLKGDKTWLIVRESSNGDMNFYSISDSEKVLIGIKK